MYPTDSEGNIQGASTVLAPDKARLSGEYYKLPKETILPDGMLPFAKVKAICKSEIWIRYYGKDKPANIPGEIAGGRLVREWNPQTGETRTWYETIDIKGQIMRK